MGSPLGLQAEGEALSPLSPPAWGRQLRLEGLRNTPRQGS